MTLASTLLVFGSVAAFATIYSGANRKIPVVMVTKTIQQGQPIVAADLGAVSVSLSGAVHPIPVADASTLSGRRAAVTIPSGSLLTMADTTIGQPIAPGDAVVGVALKPGQLPSGGVEPGDHVMVVETGAPGSPLASSVANGAGSGTAAPAAAGVAGATGAADGTSLSSGAGSSSNVLVDRATVFEVQGASSTGSSADNTTATGGSSGSQLVSVEVSDQVAPAVSNAAAAGQVSLVLVPTSSTSPGSTNGNVMPSNGRAGGRAHSAKAGHPSP